MVLINRRGAKEEQRRDAGDDSETRKVDSHGKNGTFLRLVIIIVQTLPAHSRVARLERMALATRH